MEKQWIDNLRKRFEDKKAPVPEGLWDDIESAMADMEQHGGMSVKKHRARTVSIWGRWAAAAVACAVVAVGIVRYGNSESSDFLSGNSLAQKVADVSDETSTMETSDGTAVGGSLETSSPSSDKSVFSDIKSKITGVVEDARERSASDIDISVDDKDLVAEKSLSENNVGDVDERQKKGVSVVNRPPDSRKARYYNSGDDNLLASAPERHHVIDVSVGLYGTNLTAVGSSGNGGTLAMPMNVYADPIMNKDFTLLTIDSRLNRADASENEINVKHRQPVRVGMSVRFKLTDRLGIETGMNYSYLSSEIASGDEDGGFRTEQKLHYVGVPLGLNYGIWSTDYLEIYASAGATAEFCVSGKSGTDYVSGETIIKHSEYEVKDSRPQWSVNAAAGVQYNFNNVIGVYVEPGVSYYFNNGSDVTTIYKDKPFNFNLNLGLRFTVR
ncbi:uncharacterized protein BN473_00961 [Prevotella sp. CAG:1185]|nr:uncharacterized protein BN473_00961 [Prevotella sp. CAG:1185]